MVEVHGHGPKPAQIMIIGEAPGKQEMLTGKPFSGPSGKYQEYLISRCSNRTISPHEIYYTNVSKRYHPDNPNPAQEEIDRYTPMLINEIRQVQPRVIFAVGGFATRWLLGQRAIMRMCHGVVHVPGEFDNQISNRCYTIIPIIPVYHPAFGLRDVDSRALVEYDYQRAIDVYMSGCRLPSAPIDIIEYKHINGENIRQYIHDTRHVAIDTEGYDTLWSVQFSTMPGTGYTLREDFHKLSTVIDACDLIIMHNAMHDVPLLQSVGVHIPFDKLVDTMYMAYLLRLEPRSLKQLAWRWARIKMKPFFAVCGLETLARQIEYLQIISTLDVDKNDKIKLVDNDGTIHNYRCQTGTQKARSILNRVLDNSLDSDTVKLYDPYTWSNGTPIDRAWYSADLSYEKGNAQRRSIRRIESIVGCPMPRAHLQYADKYERLQYECCDPDATLRIYLALRYELERLGIGQNEDFKC